MLRRLDRKPGTPAPSCSRIHARPLVTKAAEKSNIVTMGNWKALGVDVMNSTLAPGIKEQLVQYGELIQAAYDNLGKNRCKPEQYGNAVEVPDELLAYTKGNYRVAEGEKGPEQSTYDRYKLPPAFKQLGIEVSPLIEALPGKGNGVLDLPSPIEKLRNVQTLLVDKYFTTLPGLLVTFIEGSNGGRALFPKKKDGRGKQPRGTFFGFIAVSHPPAAKAAGAEKGRDVALVWRGTVFREEWESNFAQDELALWDPDRDTSTASLLAQSKVLPKADQVGVHAGFDDLYTRSSTKVVGGIDVSVPSPREVVHAWLPQLLKEHNVSTITTTGHSLGGGLATLSAFDVAQHLKKNWDTWDRTGWQTQECPKVRLVTYATPRLGNATFVDAFHGLGIAALRIENKGDVVPKVPGVWVQLLTLVVEKFSSEAAVDMTSGPASFFRGLYRFVCRCFEVLGFYSRWGYFHVGQTLELDPAWARSGLLDPENLDPPRKHNLELYLYLVSLLGPEPPVPLKGSTTRNPLLLNKSDDLLLDKTFPADWWLAPDRRGYKQQDGYWVYPTEQTNETLAAVSNAEEKKLVESGVL